MYEVELKLRADHDRVRGRLDDIGATHVGTVTQEDTYFDAPDRNFADTDEALRIRRERRGDNDPAVATLTYKGPLVEEASKTRQEAETHVEDGAALRSILEGLGYQQAATVRKERTRYSVEDCTVTLDAVEGLGEFVEIEIETERELGAGNAATAEGLDELRGEAVGVLEQLGFDPGEQIRTSYLGLLLAEE